MRANIRLRLCIALIAVLALGAIAAACGGGDDSDDASSTPTRGATSPTAAVTRPATSPTVGSSPTAAAADATATAPLPVPPAPSRTPPVGPPPVPPTSAPPPPPPPPPPSGVSITIAAFDALDFSPTSATAPAGSAVTLTFDNQDAGILHDLTLYSPTGSVLAATDVFEGVAQRTVTFTVGAAGSYPFICSVHPQDMRGTLAVQ